MVAFVSSSVALSELPTAWRLNEEQAERWGASNACSRALPTAAGEAVELPWFPTLASLNMQTYAAAAEMWQPRALANHHGGARVKVGQTSEIVEVQGGSSARETTLSQFVHSITSSQPAAVATKPADMLFDQTLLCQSEASGLCEHDAVPPGWLAALVEGRSEPHRFASIGSDGRGVGFHSHHLTIFSLLHGSKGWVLVPPFQPPGSNSSVRCLQRAGELLFIPEGWSHATLNFGDAIGLSLQAIGGYRSEAQRLLGLIAADKARGDLRNLRAHLEALVEAVPTEGMPKVELATELARLGLHRESAQERARIEGLLRSGCELAPDHWAAHARAAEYFSDEGGTQEARRLAARAYALAPHQPVACTVHARAEYAVGNWAAAAAALRESLSIRHDSHVARLLADAEARRDREL